MKPVHRNCLALAALCFFYGLWIFVGTPPPLQFAIAASTGSETETVAAQDEGKSAQADFIVVAEIDSFIEPKSPAMKAAAKAFEESKTRILEKWQAIELPNTEFVFTKNGSDFTAVAVRIKPLNTAHLGSLSDIVKEELKQFEGNPATYRKSKEPAANYINRLSGYQRTNQFLIIVYPKEGSAAPSLATVDTNLEKLPEDSIELNDESLVQFYDTLNSSDSWEAKRYRHIIESFRPKQ